MESRMIGEVIRTEREKKLLTLGELAKASGVRYVTIWRIENNRLARGPQLETLMAIAAGLKIKVETLISRSLNEHAA